jgi:hypothetical protein
MASEKILPILQEASVEMTLGRLPVTTCVFGANIAGQFICGLDVLRAYDVSVDLGRRALRLGNEEFPVLDPKARPYTSPYIKRYETQQRGSNDSVW